MQFIPSSYYEMYAELTNVLCMKMLGILIKAVLTDNTVI